MFYEVLLSTGYRKLFSWIKIHIKDGCNVVVRRELKSIIKN